MDEKKTPKPPLPLRMWTQSNMPIPRPTPLSTQNGIQIQSAIFPQLTHQTDRQTDRWDSLFISDKSVRKSAYTLLIVLRHG